VAVLLSDTNELSDDCRFRCITPIGVEVETVSDFDDLEIPKNEPVELIELRDPSRQFGMIGSLKGLPGEEFDIGEIGEAIEVEEVVVVVVVEEVGVVEVDGVLGLLAVLVVKAREVDTAKGQSMFIRADREFVGGKESREDAVVVALLVVLVVVLIG
jgi:hypothetical protein